MQLSQLVITLGIILNGCGEVEAGKAGRFSDGKSTSPARDGTRNLPSGSDDSLETGSENGADALPQSDAPSLGEIDTAPEDAPTDDPLLKPATEADIFRDFPAGQDQLKVICARPGRDKVRQVFCAPNPPKISSLVDLQTALGLGFASPNQTGRGNNGRNGNPGFAILGHSSSLVARYVSAINPRVIMFSPPNILRDPDYVALGFVRGEPFAEIIANDPDTNVAAFFLLKFEQACGEECKPGDLLTPAVEKNWTNFTLYEDVDLKNTVVDCLHCHQPEGPGTPKILRMQELRNPWTHFFRNNNAGGQALIADFQAAHGTQEDYGGIPAAQITSSEPANLENFVRANGFGNQPNEFPTGTIEREVRASSQAQPRDNSKPGVSATWQRIYDQARSGNFIAVPYHDVKVTDPTKLTAMTSAYKAVQSGAMPQSDLPDIREVFLESRKHEMGFAVQPGSTPQEILMQACAQCHNSKLDQSLTRARFNVDLSKMGREEKDRAIERLKLPAADPKRMPPERFRSLTDEEIVSLIKLLEE